MAKHVKHPKLVKPDMGLYGRNEWAFHGTPCSRIQETVRQLLPILSKNFNPVYIDTDHRSFKEELSADYLENGAVTSVSDKQNYLQLDTSLKNPDFDYKIALQSHDLVLLNGNHHTGKKQIVFLDESKIESLERKSDKLTDIQAFITISSYNVVPTHIIDKNPGYKSIPVYSENDISELASLIGEKSTENGPKLKALILAGGMSTRMGTDKGLIDYHGQNQAEFLADLMSKYVSEVKISCRADQTENFSGKYPTLTDRIEGMGPYGGILTAFMDDPNSAWLVLACDLPLVNATTIEGLLEKRDPSSVATSYRNPETDFPEPLLTIWEPKAYSRLLQFMALGYSCPRKVLINSDVNVIESSDPERLMNANTPEDYELAKSKINAEQ